MPYQRLKRVEIWSDVACAGGVRLAFYAGVVGARRFRQVNGREELTLTLDRNAAAWGSIAGDRVIRLVLTDGDWSEWRILEPTQAQQEDGSAFAEVVAVSILYDLGHTTVARTEANGYVSLDFPLLGLTPAEHAAAALAHAFPYFTLGTVEVVERIDIDYSWDTPLSILRAICSELEARGIPCELSVTRNGVVGYVVNLLAQVGASGEPQLSIEYRKNLQGMSWGDSAESAPVRVYPRGAELETEHTTMAAHAWEVAELVDQGTYRLVGDPIPFNGLLLGDEPLYLEGLDPSGGGRSIITGTTAPDRIHVDDVVEVNADVGQLVRVVRAGGARLTFLQRAAAHRRDEVLDASDVPAVNNELLNPLLDEWTGATLDHWTAVGAGVVITKEIAPDFHRSGSAAARVVAPNLNTGIASAWTPIYATPAHPFYAGQVSLMVIAGRVRLEIEARTAGGALTRIPAPDSLVKAFTSQRGVWVEMLSIIDQSVNFAELELVEARLLVLADVSASEFVLDVGQLVNSAVGDLPLYGGRASNDLWRRAAERLAEAIAPNPEISVKVVDLFRLNTLAFSADALWLGRDVLLYHSQLGLSYATRILETTEDLLTEGLTDIKLARVPQTLLGALGLGKRPKKRRRQQPQQPQQPENYAEIAFQLTAPAANVIQIGLTEIGTATMFWSAYVRRGAWPTIDGLEGGALSATYRVADMKPVQESSLTKHALLGGLWYVIVVAHNEFGDDGDRPTDSIDMDSAPGGGVLTNVQADGAGPGTQIKVSWEHNQELADAGAGVYTVDIERKIGNEIEYTMAAAGVNPKLDGASDSAPLKGFWTDPDVTLVFKQSSNDPNYKWVEYRLTLRAAGVAVATYIAGSYEFVGALA